MIKLYLHEMERISRSMGQVHSTVPLALKQQNKYSSFSNGVNLGKLGNLSARILNGHTGDKYEEESKDASPSPLPTSTSLDNDDNEPLPFMKASSYGSRRKDDSFSKDLTDVMDFFECGDSDFSDSTLIRRWVGGSHHSNSNCNHYHQNSRTQSPTPTELSVVNIHSTSLSTSAASPMKTVPITLHNLELDPSDKEPTCTDPLFPNDTSILKDDLPGVNYPNAPSKSSTSSGSHNPKRAYKIIPRKQKAGKDLESKMSKSDGNQALGLVLSAMYGKLLVVMGIAFPMSEVISTYIPPSFYDGFYLYLYFGSITFMICIYGNILSQKATRSVRYTMQRIHSMRCRLTSANSGVQRDVTTTDCDNISCSDSSEGTCSDSPVPTPLSPSIKIDGLDIGSATDFHPGDYAYQRIHFGSFYLRMGAVAFGIGSMIYSGLEFGQYFELEPDTNCHNFMIALTPAVRMIFTFMQMYFIFMNSKMAVSKTRGLFFHQFGLMHMIGTNLCVWLNVLVQETRHEILHFYNPDNNSMTDNYINLHFPDETLGHENTDNNVSYYPDSADLGFQNSPLNWNGTENATGQLIMAAIQDVIIGNASDAVGDIHVRQKRGLRGPHSLYECRRTDIMGKLVQNASPFLFPCSIEYSLICAAILYVMWKSMAKCQAALNRHQFHMNRDSHIMHGVKRSPHHYSVDCARANKGLFLGIFILVMTIISLILYFVLITRPEYQALATLEVNITELALYTTTTVAVLIGMCQIRELRFVLGRNLELDNILLIVAQTGSFIYNVFTVIGGHFTLKTNTVLVMMTALASLIQLLFQTLFILDASKRCAATADQARRKPGREVVTFLLVTNLAMWAINTLEKSRADSHPVQLKFYGVWAWTIITHISMPLAIFYRFHSTVCLCEIWKKAYKLKPIYR